MKIEFITATCNMDTLNNNLSLSRDLWKRYSLNVIRNSTHLTKDIQECIDKSEADIICIIHDDVRLLEGFYLGLWSSINKLNKDYPNWAIAGVAGATLKDGVIAHIVDRQVVLGEYISSPIQVETIDEVLVVINKKSGLKLDENIKTHHLWATDLCLQAKTKGYGCYIIEALIHHNSNNNYVLGLDFYNQVGYIKKKWYKECPIRTTCITI